MRTTIRSDGSRCRLSGSDVPTSLPYVHHAFRVLVAARVTVRYKSIRHPSSLSIHHPFIQVKKSVHRPYARYLGKIFDFWRYGRAMMVVVYSYSSQKKNINGSFSGTRTIRMMLSTLFVSALLFAFTEGFVPRSSRASEASRQTRLFILPTDPLFLDLGIAAVSAAAGAASQLPRIQELQRELEISRAALTESENEMVTKIHDLEEKLFQMDREYEGQTEKFKKQYDTKMRGELEKISDKIKTDFNFKLQIKIDEERSKMLSEKLRDVTQVGEKQAEIAQLRLDRSKVDKANRELEKAMADAKDELDKMYQLASRKKKWWPF